LTKPQIIVKGCQKAG
jgi:sodium/potassium-transporting ATPase subunit alpha